jgi:hypothetical protein
MVGIISEALEIVSSDPSIKLKTSSISLLWDPSSVVFQASTPGEKTIHIKISWQTWASITFSVSDSSDWKTVHASAWMKCLYTMSERMKYFF